jgi:uncharacterized protein YjiS (DUF1127 family)
MRELSSRSKAPSAQQVARQHARLETLNMPAMPPLWLFALIGRALQRRRERRALKALLERHDHILCDLGYSRAQLRQRLKQPPAPRPATCCMDGRD